MEAQRVKEKFMKFMRRFTDPNFKFITLNANTLEQSVPCDQRLLPGMNTHWGELRSCAIHPRDQGPFRVCKGCRVFHQMLPGESYDHQLVATRGARVAVCGDCAVKVMQGFRVGDRECVCYRKWTCRSCREVELVKLARARQDKYQEGRCGRCLAGGELVGNVDFCLSCRGVRIYEE